MILKLVGALLLTYFASRATRLALKPAGSAPRLVLAHVAAFMGIAAFVFLVRYPSANFALPQLTVYVLPQLFWLTIDALRDERIISFRPRH